LHTLLASGQVPPAVLKPQCRGCSLRPVCLPDMFGNTNKVARLLANLFNQALSEPAPTA
jgi:hypothetical protein